MPEPRITLLVRMGEENTAAARWGSCRGAMHLPHWGSGCRGALKYFLDGVGIRKALFP